MAEAARLSSAGGLAGRSKRQRIKKKWNEGGLRAPQFLGIPRLLIATYLPSGTRRKACRSGSYNKENHMSHEKSMKRKILRAIILGSIALVVLLGAAWQEQAQDTKAPYPNMAPLEQYLISDRNAEIALARSAAPPSISHDATVMVLGRHGYETSVEANNTFFCALDLACTNSFDI